MNTPNHVAIIMDGNGRWANARKHNRVYGHIRGAKVAYNIIKHTATSKVKYLTLFAFSTENWSRPKTEVSLLMSLLIKNLKKEQKTLIDNNIKFKSIGDQSQLPTAVQDLLHETTEVTKSNTGLILTFALNYGGQQEIIETVKYIAEKYANKAITLDQINTDYFSNQLQSTFLPDPDLIIRTSNEKRLSNFFLWQSAYSEFYFTKKFWPDFEISDFELALENFGVRKRRFGSISPPNNPSEQNNFYG